MKIVRHDGPMDQLIRALASLPGLGPRSARRIALHLLSRRDSGLRQLAHALEIAEKEIRSCAICGNLDAADPCRICAAAERRRRMDELLAAYPMLRRKLRDKAFSLSGGERQVLALARALMPSPKYLLLDEPSAGLSPLMLEEVFAAIVEIVRQTGIAVLLVEQNATEALAISDRAYVLVLGQVALSGAAETILADDQVRQLYLGGAAV